MFSLYVHIPFCLCKCGYCAFNSRPLSDAGKLDQYFDALEAEIAMRLPKFSQRPVDTLYFGGGTPSIATPDQLGRIFTAIERNGGKLSPNAEITLEANPDTLTKEKLAGFFDIGFNRLSLGAQSFSEEALAFLERNHKPDQVEKTFALARETGFKNISLDLITGLPEPLTDGFREDIQRALTLAPEHLSVYQLAVEEPSRLAIRVGAGQVTPLDTDRQADIFLECHSILERGGYEHYEVSNYARPGLHSRHNSAYWNGGWYLGLGAGAHSYLPGDSLPTRSANHGDPMRYGERVAKGKMPFEFSETITKKMQVREAMMLKVRTREGFRIDEFGDLGPGLTKISQIWIKNGLYEIKQGRLLPTSQGMLMADSIAADLWDILDEMVLDS